MATDEVTGFPLKHVKVTVRFKAGADLANYTKTTSENGIYIFKKLPEGKCKIIFELAYYDTLKVDSVIYKDEHTRLDVEIRKTE